MIYLDSAATTMQKPIAVSNAVSWSINHLASPGRGGHYPAMEAGRLVYQCREEAARFFAVKDPANVVFTSSATHGLNLAIKSVVKPNSDVLVSGYEHNAVTRVLSSIPGVKIRRIQTPLFSPELMLEEFKRELSCKVSVVVCTHVSNVFGYILPIEEIALLCNERGIPLILDASQSAGTLPVSMERTKASFIAMPGHKGLYGPQGTGILLCGKEVKPLLEGGTGSISIRQTMPDFLPDRLEAGTHNVPGIVGLLEGLKFTAGMGLQRIFEHERELIRRAAEQLKEIKNVRVYYDETGKHQSGVCSFACKEADCERIGEELGRRGIAVRAGLHCAPYAHETVGTLDCGTVRFSVSIFNEAWEMDEFTDTLREIIS